ncbi:MAG: hypothetical protein ACRCSN_00465 [Dermatophilaceae bacterium]
MPNIFSNLYGAAPNSNATQFIYRGPQAERSGQTVLRFAQYTGAITFNATPALNDVLFIAGGFLAGERIRRITNVRSADPDSANDFTFNLGFRLAGQTAFAAASTGMQAATAFEVTEAAALAVATAAQEGDDLVLTATAGAAEVATVTHSFLIESYTR